MENKRPRGRTPGWSPGMTRKPATHYVGPWAWDHDRLMTKVEKGLQDDCWQWRGSRNAMGNLFGAYKQGKAQMIQANRLIYMALHGEAIEGYGVYMKCGNRYCCNPDHFELLPTRLYTKNAKTSNN